MNKILMIIGSIVITLGTMSVPILCTLAFVYNWDDEIKFLILIVTFGLGIALWTFIYKEATK